MTTLDPMLDFLNTNMNNSGIQEQAELRFYTSHSVFKVSIKGHKYFVSKENKKANPGDPLESLPVLVAGDLSGVLTLLSQEPTFLSASEVGVQWINQTGC